MNESDEPDPTIDAVDLMKRAVESAMQTVYGEDGVGFRFIRNLEKRAPAPVVHFKLATPFEVDCPCCDAALLISHDDGGNLVLSPAL